jgi:hypothetical protein
MHKVCVFCGEKPSSKTKEHVLPKWLLSMTGDPKRTIALAFPYSKAPVPAREIAFDQLHFPACDSCNGAFSVAESLAKDVVERLLRHQPLAATDFSVLLDWLDKVRIGLWLGFLYLGRNPFSIEPNFHISTRIGGKDRAVMIYRTNDGRAGLHFQGVNVPMFHFMPSCFTLVVNDFYFFNLSADFLIARRIGLPFPASAIMRDDGRIELTMSPGQGRPMWPPIRLPFSRAGTEIYQPMFANEVFADSPETYDTDYVRSMSLDWKAGIGWPICFNEGTFKPFGREPTLDWLPVTTMSRADLHILMIRQTLTMQANLWDYLFSTDDPGVRAAVKKSQRINRTLSKLPTSELSGLKDSAR